MTKFYTVKYLGVELGIFATDPCNLLAQGWIRDFLSLHQNTHLEITEIPLKGVLCNGIPIDTLITTQAEEEEEENGSKEHNSEM